MNKNEIETLAGKVADELYHPYGKTNVDLMKEEFVDVINIILKDYCIVPKAEVLKQHTWYMQRMKEVSSSRQMNRGKALALENLFGKEIFEEKEI
ncbi:MAG: hypothetical protein HDS83_03515 [Bacteroidales bacterium]|nr:hypothetical protein [Bacteroidales bacterium]